MVVEAEKVSASGVIGKHVFLSFARNFYLLQEPLLGNIV